MASSQEKVPPEALHHYGALLATFPDVEQKGATMPYTAVNGNMFSFLTADGTLALRLPAADRATFLSRYDTGLVEQHGAIMKEYVAVPGALLANTEELTPFFAQSLTYATSLKPKPSSAKKRAVTEFASGKEWEIWLGEHHAEPVEVWVKIPKTGTPANLISYDDAVEVALCYGWIDSQAAKFDDGYWLQRFTARRTKSPWSKINRARAEKLIEQGKMQPPGLQEVHRAQQDGRWAAAYDSPSTAEPPEDLIRALNSNDRAREFFATLDKTNRFAIIHQIEEAKRPETRTRRIDKYVEMLSAHQKVYSK